ncbi:MAG: glycogen synthase GlgA [Gammaproteobacteria bacterium]|nr:MAG: glycogen synthase GlgA [Gammaproteobacteria bacterium]
MRILFATTEFEGLVKVGGLADFAAGLGHALARAGEQLRVLLPYFGSVQGAGEAPVIAELPGGGCLRELRPRPRGLRIWLVDQPHWRARAGNPYTAPDGRGWPDDGPAFSAFSRLAAQLAGDRLGLGWRADVVHANDWPTALVPVWLMLERVPVASVFTIHNLAYQGLFPASSGAGFGLPPWLFHPEALEYWGQWSFLKGGLVFADRLTTVSPSYAAEIRTPAFGEGLDGVLRARGPDLEGIVNGIEEDAWNPARDPALPAHFSAARPAGRTQCVRSLRAELGLTVADDVPLAAFVGRVQPQKGIAELLAALPQLLELPLAVAVLGSGDATLEAGLRAAAARYPGRCSVTLRYDDGLGRRLCAGSDLLLMPSRFEPCGLTQLYAMRYGCIPVAHAVGGLRDTITDATPAALGDGSATGVLYGSGTAAGLVGAVRRALSLRADPERWQRLQQAGMRGHHGWGPGAAAYQRIYDTAREKGTVPFFI